MLACFYIKSNNITCSASTIDSIIGNGRLQTRKIITNAIVNANLETITAVVIGGTSLFGGPAVSRNMY